MYMKLLVIYAFPLLFLHQCHIFPSLPLCWTFSVAPSSHVYPADAVLGVQFLSGSVAFFSAAQTQRFGLS